MVSPVPGIWACETPGHSLAPVAGARTPLHTSAHTCALTVNPTSRLVFEAQSIPVADPGSSLPPVASRTENEKCTPTCTMLTSAAVAPGYLFYSFLSRCCLAAVSCVLASPLHQFMLVYWAVCVYQALEEPHQGGSVVQWVLRAVGEQGRNTALLINLITWTFCSVFISFVTLSYFFFFSFRFLWDSCSSSSKYFFPSLLRKMLTACDFSAANVDEMMYFICDLGHFHFLR